MENENNNLEESKKEDININVTKSEKKKAKKKKKTNKQLLAVILIIIACVAITIALIVLKIRNINKAYAPKQENNVFVSEEKQEDDELKYVLTENDTLDFNDIEIIDKWIVDGREVDYEEYSFNNKKYNYIKISGLKDKNIENKINEDIKSSILKLGESYNEKHEVYIVRSVDICGNFSNILSLPVRVHSNENKNFGLNYNLKTGEKFTFEDVFIKSAPIVSMIYNGVIKSLAWDINYPDSSNFKNGEEYWNYIRKLQDMENRDTSEYEDVALKVAKWYKENKGNIKFSVSDNKISVYDIKLDGYDKAYDIEIESYIYKDYMAIYKRFAGGDLYESDINGGGYIPFTERMAFGNQRKEAQLAYGKKSDNLFVDIGYGFLYSTLEDKNVEKKIRDFSQIIANNLVADITKEANSNLQNGYVLQATVGMNSSLSANNYYYDNDNNRIYTVPHHSFSINPHKAIITKDDFKDLNKHLAICALRPHGGTMPFTIYNTLHDILLNKPEEESYYSEQKTYYFDINGNYLGDNIECIKDTTTNVEYNPS